ncbi:MAG: tyrosine-type recombinase/integrase [Armatimonadetes bacterium]|nr:tyrosine-type recombinase/integrase [Armatimonadota bacterium]
MQRSLSRSEARRLESEKYIRLGKDGKFHVEIDKKTPGGEDFRKASKYVTLDKAVAARDEWLKLWADDQSAKVVTLDQWAEECFEEIMPIPHTRKKALKPNTINGYRLLYNMHVSPVIGRMELRKVKTSHMIEIIHHRMTCRDSDTQANVRTVVSKLYTLAQAFEKVPLGYNPVKLVTVPRTGIKHDEEGFEIRSVRNLTESEQEQLLSASALHAWRFSPSDEIFTGEDGRPWLYLANLMGLRMGLRRGEILGFNLRHVDWNRRLYDVRWQVNRIYKPDKGDFVQASDSLKKEGSYRKMPIPPSVFDELVRIRERKPDTVFVFDCPDGKHRNPEDLNSAFKIAAREAGLLDCRDDRGGPLKNPTPHDMRHTFGYMHANVYHTPHTALQKLMGHKNIQTTLSYYAVASVDDVIAAMARVA